MSYLPRSLVAHLVAHHGVVDRLTLTRLGVGTHEFDRLLRAGTFVTIHTGVFRVATSPATFEARCLAACLADNELVICGPSAARHWSFKHTGTPDDVYATVPHDRTPVSTGVILRRCNVVTAEDIVAAECGLRVTSPPRTWFDRGRDLDDHHFEALTEHVLNRHTTMPTLWRTSRRLCQRGRPGSARVRRVLSMRPSWQKPADSTLEFDVLKAFRTRGVHFVAQHSLTLRNGRRIHLDGADPDIRFGIEVDHYEWHQGRDAAERDDDRNRATERIGWRVLRITDHAWKTDREAIIDDIIAIYVARGGQRRPSPSRLIS